MANKNRNLIVAYYDSADAADEAAQKLKHWDKEDHDIKLGGMGIITMEDGKLKTHKVGARAAGTGAKWGSILGATGGLATGLMAAAGVLTGGLGLIPGAIAGLALGAGAGELFHKKVGMTDEDRARLEDHLGDGGAALAVMADDFEVEPTKAEIAALGGAVEHYTVPDEVMDELDETREAVEEVHTSVAKEMADHPQETLEAAAAMLLASPALVTDDVVVLTESGVDDLDDLHDAVDDEASRAKLIEDTGFDADKVTEVTKDLDLSRVRGVGRKYLKLLNAAGVETVADLASYSPDELAALLSETNEKEGIVAHMPSEEKLSYWIAQARELPPYLRAIKVIKEMLAVDNYEWHASGGDDPRKIQADAIMFNRKEGYEVRLMIQKIVNTFGFETVEDVQRVEQVIAEELPGNVRSQENVYNWLVDYFESN